MPAMCTVYRVTRNSSVVEKPRVVPYHWGFFVQLNEHQYKLVSADCERFFFCDSDGQGLCMQLVADTQFQQLATVTLVDIICARPNSIQQ